MKHPPLLQQHPALSSLLPYSWHIRHALHQDGRHLMHLHPTMYNSVLIFNQSNIFLTVYQRKFQTDRKNNLHNYCLKACDLAQCTQWGWRPRRQRGGPVKSMMVIPKSRGSLSKLTWVSRSQLFRGLSNQTHIKNLWVRKGQKRPQGRKGLTR